MSERQPQISVGTEYDCRGVLHANCHKHFAFCKQQRTKSINLLSFAFCFISLEQTTHFAADI